MQQQTPKDFSPQLAVAILKNWAMTLYLPLRLRVGRDHIGFGVFFGWFFIFMWSEMAKAPGLLWLVPINFASAFILKLGQFRRRWQGVYEHTEYGGTSWLMEFILRNEDLAKQFGEPLLSILIGVVIYHYSSQPNAAPYFWWGGGVMFWWHLYCKQQGQRLIDRANNLAIENRHIMANFRRRI